MVQLSQAVMPTARVAICPGLVGAPVDNVQVDLPTSESRPEALLKQVNQQMKQLSTLQDCLGISSARRLATGMIPFIASVVAEVLQQGMKLSFLKSYDGSLDLEDHLTQYQSFMQLHGFTNAIGARISLLPLKGQRGPGLTKYLQA